MAFDSWRKNYIPEDPHEMYLTEGDLEMAYKAATAAKREKCAVICDAVAASYAEITPSGIATICKNVARECAEAIRKGADDDD